MLSVSDSPGRCGIASVVATRSAIPAASDSGPSSHSHAPSENRGNTSAAVCTASRVLPTPPTPVSVTIRTSPSAVATSSISSTRPTNDVSCCGRFVG